MMRRFLSYFLSLFLLMLPAYLLFLVGSETGTLQLAQIVEKFTDFKIVNPKGTLLSGKIEIENINNQTLQAHNIKIDISRNPTFPFFQINEIEIAELRSDPFFKQSKSTSNLIPTPKLIKIASLKINNPLGTPILAHNAVFSHDKATTSIQVDWHQKPLSLTAKEQQITDEKSELKITAAYEGTQVTIFGQKTPNQRHFQSLPSEPGHLVFYHNQQNNQWTLDVDYQLQFSDQLSVSAKLTANWNGSSGSILANQIKITDQEKETLIAGNINIDQDNIQIDLKSTHQDNSASLRGNCGEQCDITLNYHLENLEQISSRFAGDAEGNIHVFGDKNAPDLYARHHANYFRNRLLSFNDLNVEFEKVGEHSKLKVHASDIGSANTLLKQPFTLEAKGIANRITGYVMLLANKVRFAGNIEDNSSLRIYKENIPKPYQLSNDIMLSYNSQSLHLNLHPTCLKFAENKVCLAARIGPKYSFFDFEKIKLRGELTLPLHDKTALLHISSYLVDGNFSLHLSDTLKLKSNLKIDTGKGFLSNIVPNFFIPINYSFDHISLHTAEKANQFVGEIHSPEGNTIINLNADEENSGLNLNISTPNLRITHHHHIIAGSQELSCQINALTSDCMLQAILKNSKLKFTAIAPTTELPSDIVIDTPVQIKHSSKYAFNVTYQITLGENNTLDIAGFSGPLIGNITIKSPHTQPTTASGVIEIKPAIFSLFGKTIQLKQAQMIYHNDPVNTPMFNINASKNVHTSDAQLTTVSLSVFGRAENFNVDLKSTPAPMSQLEMISNLFSSKNKKNWQPEQDQLTLSILNQAGSSSGALRLIKTLSDFERGLNIDSVAISPQFSVTNDITAPKITLKKSLFDKTYLKYQFLLHDNRNGTLSLVYQLPRNLFFELFLNRENQGINLLYQND